MSSFIDKNVSEEVTFQKVSQVRCCQAGSDNKISGTVTTRVSFTAPLKVFDALVQVPVVRVVEAIITNNACFHITFQLGGLQLVIALKKVISRSSLLGAY